MNNLYRNLENCTDCELHKGPGCVVRGLGSLAPEVLILGEAPRAKEEETGKPFVGKSGQLLQQLLRETGYTMDELYITNVVKHRPPSNRNPTSTEIIACGNHLQQELALVRPKHIICVSRVPAEALHLHQNQKLPKGSLRGYTFRYKQYPVTCTWHPAYVLRNKTKRIDLVNDLAAARCKARAIPRGNP